MPSYARYGGESRATRLCVQPPSAGLTSNSRCRINDAGLQNREENGVLPERRGPFDNADEELFNQVQCTESFPLLKTG